jgi:hypothetical protein
MSKPRADFATRFSSERQPVSNGRPQGSRDRLSTAFLKALADDFEVNGKEAIEKTRAEDPAAYLRVVASLQPKEIKLEKPEDALSDEAMDALIAAFTAHLAAQSDQKTVN